MGEKVTEKSRKKKIWIIILIIALLCVITSASYFIYLKIESDKMDDFKDEVTVSTDDTSSAEPEVETPVDFKKLKKQNPDIYAWINIPGMVIDYPILRNPNNDRFYLTHSVDLKKSKYGAIYTHNYNDMEFNDFNTVVYGHNMRNGTMFGSLKKFRDNTFFEQNRYINIYMPGRILKYEIFAAYVFDDRHILLNFDFSDINVRKEYLDMIFSTRKVSANIKHDIAVTENDKIITLSTCTSNDNERYLVQGVLIYDSREQFGS
ncbi:MAG: class B sortase [Clostridia bacterium]|nr:class B sortase [Clostridia bacterium]